MKSLAIVGLPNTGKSTFFNRLTGASAKVGNWPGITVELYSARIILGAEAVEVVDLPGIYNLHGFSEDEKVARRFLEHTPLHLLAVIVNATQLDRDGLPHGEKTRGRNQDTLLDPYIQRRSVKTMSTNQGNRIDLPVKGRLLLLHATSFLIAILMAGVAIAGLRERAITYPTEELVQTFVPNDVVNLLIGLPVLLGSMWLAWRGKWNGSSPVDGSTFLRLLNYTAYVFAIPLNWAFMACLFLLVLSAYTLIALVAMIDGKAVQEKLTGARPAHADRGLGVPAVRRTRGGDR